METFSFCYVIDCSGSMVAMPKEGLQYVQKLLIEIEEEFQGLNLPNVSMVLHLVKFGSYLEHHIVTSQTVTKLIAKDKWDSEMGQTSLYDAIIASCLLSRSTHGGVMVIITDGDENFSWFHDNLTAIKALKRFRQNNGKVLYVGLGDEKVLREKLGNEIDKVYPVDPLDKNKVHREILGHIGSKNFGQDVVDCVKLSATLCRK